MQWQRTIVSTLPTRLNHHDAAEEFQCIFLFLTEKKHSHWWQPLGSSKLSDVQLSSQAPSPLARFGSWLTNPLLSLFRTTQSIHQHSAPPTGQPTRPISQVSGPWQRGRCKTLLSHIGAFFFVCSRWGDAVVHLWAGHVFLEAERWQSGRLGSDQRPNRSSSDWPKWRPHTRKWNRWVPNAWQGSRQQDPKSRISTAVLTSS